MSDLDEAFLEMVDTQDEARGKEITITVATASGIRALEWPIRDGEILVDGAVTTSGGFRHQFLVSAVPFVPQTLDRIVASEGTELQIQSVNRINDTWQTEAFSPVATGGQY